MVVYLDIIWVLNLMVDSLLLWLTAIFLKRTIHLGRVFLGGLLGSMLIVLAITPISNWAGHPLVKIGVSIGMILIVFGYKRMKYFLSGLLTFYFATFLMGGIIIGTHYFLAFDLQLKSVVFLESIRGFGDPISWVFVMAAFPAAWHFSRRRMDGFTIAKIEYDVLSDVMIEINGITFMLKGLIDSGNQLYDPITNTPVMIVSSPALADKLPKEILLLAADDSDSFQLAASLPPEWSSIMRLIPAKTLSRNNQLLCAFKPESISLQDENGVRIVKKALIVFSNQALSSDDRFQCIIHPQMASGSVVHPAS